ncbi:MAG: PilZ domain-containing protein [Alphaproteobacteria bacterium]|nr:PilZ domain-containing protein [Alphaproteobacteria bacterium]
MLFDKASKLERRVQNRRKTLGNGVIYFASGSYAMDCVILDLSESGARIRPADAPTCPDEFLLDSKEVGRVFCEVMWRRNDLIGVRFV